MKSQLINNCGFISKNVLLIAAMILFFGSCSDSDDDNYAILKPIESHKLDILETSDLCFGSTTSVLYTVSDNSAKVYKISTSGRTLAELQFTGNDLEGVCFVDNQFLYVAEERLRKIVKLDLQGSFILEKTMSVEQNVENEGLEGISYATFNQHFYIINEMNPSLLIETDKNFNLLASYTLTFAKDYSGICVDNINQQLWIVSDLSATVNKCSLQGQVIESYNIPVTNPEGIAFNPFAVKS